MPPRSRRAAAAAAAAAPAADPPLDGCAIAISGKFDNLNLNHSGIETVIRGLGGTVTRSVTKATTHVVCSEFDYNGGTTKVAAGQAKGLPMVNPQWLLDMEDQKKKLSESDYDWGGKMSVDDDKPTKTAAKSASKKRGATADKVDDEEEEQEQEEQPKPKKARATRAIKPAPKAAPKVDDEEEEEEEQPKAKKGRATKAAPKAARKAVPKGKGTAKAAVKDEPEENLEEEKVVAEGQFIKKKGVVIPLDEFCPHANFEVYIDPDSGMIYDAALNQTNSSNNNNKFYRVQVGCVVKQAGQAFLTRAIDSTQRQDQKVPYLDAMGSCW